MTVDLLIMNTAATDLRRPEFEFTNALVGEGGLAKCRTEDMPDYSQEQFRAWIQAGAATAGGPGNTAPLTAKAGLKTAVAVNLGQGRFDGLDATGRFFYDTLVKAGVDMSATRIHEGLPSGIAFIHDKPGSDRGGIAYFPNANNDFDFEHFKAEVKRLRPRIVHYMYSGLSARGDANGGRDLADFIAWCRQQGAVTIVDSHTLTGNPAELIAKGAPVAAYELLRPLLGVVDVFFTSADECKMIENTIGESRRWNDFGEQANCTHFLQFLAQRFWTEAEGTRLFGVTVGNGAYHTLRTPDGQIAPPEKTTSHFMGGGAVDLVGAGDSFRAGLLTYLSRNLDGFRTGRFNRHEAVQMGNLMASLYVKAPLGNRYGHIRPYETLLRIVRANENYDTFEDLLAVLDD